MRRVIARQISRRRLLRWSPHYADVWVETHYLRHLIRVSHAWNRLVERVGLSEDASAVDVLLALVGGGQ